MQEQESMLEENRRKIEAGRSRGYTIEFKKDEE